jgi:hypothetical protein
MEEEGGGGEEEEEEEEEEEDDEKEKKKRRREEEEEEEEEDVSSMRGCRHIQVTPPFIEMNVWKMVKERYLRLCLPRSSMCI